MCARIDEKKTIFIFRFACAFYKCGQSVEMCFIHYNIIKQQNEQFVKSVSLIIKFKMCFTAYEKFPFDRHGIYEYDKFKGDIVVCRNVFRAIF